MGAHLMSDVFEVAPADTQLAELPPSAAPPEPESAPRPIETNEYDALLAETPAAAKPVGNEYDSLVVDLNKERGQRLRA